jgi:hypothetical protein
MEQVTLATEFEENDEERLVKDWRTSQLERLGVPRVLAEIFGGLVDWHDIARLVERGCSPELALEIVR